ncbi:MULTISPECIES: dihydroorotase [Methanobacterium]|uniref:Dihydroorotase n=1 Tax=Methanobacterium veterum TaxID=408577 RepID=A0A9E4ZZB2_9EURY|nr:MULTISPECIES: dihydroorotase family protein [Methanobacterium]MCZ3366203.1 dihydroorotase family protein [Methanobacterium veterum]MCZ3371569.1 dihydroorotase family protein [Methanobacterium veterum]
MVDLCLKNCKLVPENIECSVGIENGKIVSITKIAPKSEEEIDIKRNIVLPGLIDSHVHFRDPGFPEKETFKTGSIAAACGGFTTVLDMPNTNPPTNTKKEFLEKLKIAEKKSVVDFGLHAGVDDALEIKKIAELKPASFKIYMDLIDDEHLLDIFTEIKRLPEDHLISVHAEDKDTVKECTDKMKSNGSIDPEIYADARPPLAEDIAVLKATSLAKQLNSSIHICHVSTKKSLDIIQEAKGENCRVTSEITPHHLLLDASYFKKCGNIAKTNPPLRDKKYALGVNELEKIDVIGTDHAPHTIPEKEKIVWEAPSGIPNLETTLPLLLTEVNQNKMTFGDIKRLLCEKPAEIFNFKNKGKIAEGMDADFVVVDMKKEGIINPDEFKTKAKYSPFKGFKVKGMPVMTVVRGNVVMDNGEVFENSGKIV